MKDSKRKRPVKVNTFVYDREHGNIPLDFEGLFHEWGNEAVEDGVEGFGNFTVGIVEDESGQVHTINPNHIKFTDK